MERRNAIVMLRVNLAERRLLEAAAAMTARPLATWTRQAALAAARDRITTSVHDGGSVPAMAAVMERE